MTTTERQILREIEEHYNAKTAVHRGRSVTRDGVLNYFFSSIRRNRELIRCVSDEMASGKKVLDLGIAYGFYGIVLKEEFGLDITGLEIEENIPAYCVLPRLHGIPVVPGELSRRPLPFSDNCFDAVIFSEVLEHLRMSPYIALKELKRILKPGGLIFITTPNIACLSNVLRLLMGRNIIGMLPEDDAGLSHVTDQWVHLREYTMREVTALAESAGYKLVKKHYSISCDELPPRHNLNWKWIALLQLSRLILTVIPTLRKSLFVVGRKT